MLKLLRRWWRYLTAKAQVSFNERADPNIQLEQAIYDAQEQHLPLIQHDQAKMQEQMKKAMATLSETVGQDVPTLDEVRAKIETRYARALGASELQGATVESRMLEVERAAMNTEAQSRLAELRSQLGLPSPSDAGRPAADAGAQEPAATESGES